MRTLITLVLAVFTFACCQPKTPTSTTDGGTDAPVAAPDASVTPPPPPPPAAVDAGPCAPACAKLRALGCPAGNSVDGGDSCETVCAHTLNGTFNMNPTCLAAAQSPADVVNKCGQPCPATAAKGPPKH